MKHIMRISYMGLYECLDGGFECFDFGGLEEGAVLINTFGVIDVCHTGGY